MNGTPQLAIELAGQVVAAGEDDVLFDRSHGVSNRPTRESGAKAPRLDLASDRSRAPKLADDDTEEGHVQAGGISSASPWLLQMLSLVSLYALGARKFGPSGVLVFPFAVVGTLLYFGFILLDGNVNLLLARHTPELVHRLDQVTTLRTCRSASCWSPFRR